jgi:hypothetical protein
VRAGAFSPDGRFLVTGGGDNILSLWDRKTGEERRRFTVESVNPALENLQMMAVALASDGERLAALVVGGEGMPTHQLVVWDANTGKRLARRVTPQADFDTRFSPNVRTVANRRSGRTEGRSEEIAVEDTVTGQEFVKVAGHAPMTYSPDGQALATTLYKPDATQPGGGGLPANAEAILLTELVTGKRLARIETCRGGFALLAYSPDGKTLATAGHDGFQLWDVVTGKEVYRRGLPAEGDRYGYSFATSLAFLPDSGRLATGLMDSTVLVWDVEPARRRAGPGHKDLDKPDLEKLWADLAGADAEKAHRAVWALAGVPAKAAPFLKDHLHPTAAPDAKQVERLISDLDSSEFAVREAAAEKLRGLGEQAEPALRKALEGKPSLEVRKRLESLHADAELAGGGVVRSAEVLRTLRAIRALEAMGTAEARQALEVLAGGDPAARTTRQAKEALRR